MKKSKKYSTKMIKLLSLLVVVVAVFGLYSIFNNANDTKPEGPEANPGSSAVSVQKIEVDRPLYESLEELVQAADLVAVVEVLDDGKVVGGGLEKIESPNESTTPRTHYRARVDDIQKGNEELNSEITIMLMGGVKDGIEYRVEGVPMLNEGQKYLVFAIGGPNKKYGVIGASTMIAVETGKGVFKFSQSSAKELGIEATVTPSEIIDATR